MSDASVNKNIIGLKKLNKQAAYIILSSAGITPISCSADALWRKSWRLKCHARWVWDVNQQTDWFVSPPQTEKKVCSRLMLIIVNIIPNNI